MKNNIGKNINPLADHLFRQYHGKLVAYLSQRYGYQEIENITDAVQESFETALKIWKFAEIPENHFAWLYRVANNKLLNKIKHSNIAKAYIENSYSYDLYNEQKQKEIEDSLLKLLIYFSKADFSERNKLIVSLYFLCGFNYSEIANALIIKADNVKKIILRSKKTIKKFSEVYDDFQIQSIQELSHVLKIIYLLFNEGYKSSQKKGTINFDLCFEAMRLGKLIHGYHPENPEINSLLALMFFNSSRFPARTENNNWISIEKQNRNLWNRKLIREGFNYLHISKEKQQTLGKYYLEALISSIHCTSESYGTTDWKSIAYLYRQLEKIEPESVSVSLNRLIAESHFKTISVLLSELNSMADNVNKENTFFYFCTKAHFYAIQKEWNPAIENYQVALKHTKNKADINFINLKIREIINKSIN